VEKFYCSFYFKHNKMNRFRLRRKICYEVKKKKLNPNTTMSNLHKHYRSRAATFCDFFSSLTGPEVNFFWWKKDTFPRNQIKKGENFFWRTHFFAKKIDSKKWWKPFYFIYFPRRSHFFCQNLVKTTEFWTKIVI